MAVYAIGDVQGCYDPLRRLLDMAAFDPAADRLWFVGDLVNRGPQSLQTLRFVHGLGARAVTVLGNHDLHLLALRYGVREDRPRDTLRPVLAAADGEALVDWLRRLPLLHHDAALGFVLTHAGIYPAWDLDTAAACAGEAEAVLRGEQCPEYVRHMYGGTPARWDPVLRGYDRWRFIINAFTRMRYVGRGGELDFLHNGPPGTQPPGLAPWYEVPQRAAAQVRVLFGHWSALPHFEAPNLFPLDSGCVWGNALSALQIDSTPPRWFRVPCA